MKQHFNKEVQATVCSLYGITRQTYYNRLNAKDKESDEYLEFVKICYEVALKIRKKKESKIAELQKLSDELNKPIAGLTNEPTGGNDYSYNEQPRTVVY